MAKKLPILLSFYALSGADSTLIQGQLTYTSANDLSFKDFTRRKTFRTLVKLYRTKPYANQYIVLIFDKGKVHMKTDEYGSFYGRSNTYLEGAILQKIQLVSGEDVKLVPGLYEPKVDFIENNVIAISDIDDTLMHSYIYRKLLKFRTLMFTSVEKRRAVGQMKEVLQKLSLDGAATFYLSNSEQNLYPLIYRFLTHNSFPVGPIFLKKMRHFWDVLFNIKFPFRNMHKEQMIVNIISFFPEKKYVLMGDNTQHDLSIYLAAAEKYPERIRYILIRKVVERGEDIVLMKKYEEQLRAADIKLYYAEDFPEEFRF
ncbi:MAG TPA: App1 family protein [Chryseosolibacter sp.]